MRSVSVGHDPVSLGRPGWPTPALASRCGTTHSPYGPPQQPVLAQPGQRPPRTDPNQRTAVRDRARRAPRRGSPATRQGQSATSRPVRRFRPSACFSRSSKGRTRCFPAHAISHALRPKSQTVLDNLLTGRVWAFLMQPQATKASTGPSSAPPTGVAPRLGGRLALLLPPGPCRGPGFCSRRPSRSHPASSEYDALLLAWPWVLLGVPPGRADRDLRVVETTSSGRLPATLVGWPACAASAPAPRLGVPSSGGNRSVSATPHRSAAPRCSSRPVVSVQSGHPDFRPRQPGRGPGESRCVCRQPSPASGRRRVFDLATACTPKPGVIGPRPGPFPSRPAHLRSPTSPFGAQPTPHGREHEKPMTVQPRSAPAPVPMSIVQGTLGAHYLQQRRSTRTPDLGCCPCRPSWRRSHPFASAVVEGSEATGS